MFHCQMDHRIRSRSPRRTLLVPDRRYQSLQSTTDVFVNDYSLNGCRCEISCFRTIYYYSLVYYAKRTRSIKAIIQLTQPSSKNDFGLRQSHTFIICCFGREQCRDVRRDVPANRRMVHGTRYGAWFARVSASIETYRERVACGESGVDWPSCVLRLCPRVEVPLTYIYGAAPRSLRPPALCTRTIRHTSLTFLANHVNITSPRHQQFA